MKLRTIGPTLFLSVLLSVHASAQRAQPTDRAAEIGEIRKSLVKVFTTMREPDLARPWTKQQPREATGSGVVIDGKRILTNNHVISYASRVLVQPDGSSDKIPAKVIAAAPGIDLALLEVSDASFFNDHPAVKISDALPNVGTDVVTYGYPVGGDALSVTKGTVSRIEYTAYDEHTQALRIQVDAAVNHGNSGGPALVNDELVGLVFSGIDSAQNIGYVIPVEEIRMFLADIEDGKYDGEPHMYHSLQTLENDALRGKLKLKKEWKGIIVTKPESDDPNYPLRKWDVLSRIGDKEIDNEGMVTVRPGLRLQFYYYVPKFAKDGKVAMTIIRDGTILEVQVPVKNKRDQVFKPLAGTYPPYFIIGPLTFMPAVSELSRGINPRSLAARGSPLLHRMTDEPKFEGEQLVVGPYKLQSHPIMKGYETAPFPVLDNVNGTKIKSLRHLVEVLRDIRDEFIVFDWADDGVETLVFQRDALMKSTDEVLEDNGIRSQMSDDLKAVWESR